MRNTRDNTTKTRGLPWRLFVCLAMAAFVLRAVIPAGFMPGQSSTSLMLSLCTASGPSDIAFDLPEQSNSKHIASEACAFGTLALHAVLPEMGLAPVLSAQAIYTTPTFATYRASPPLPALGPPLGARAPPALFV